MAIRKTTRKLKFTAITPAIKLIEEFTRNERGDHVFAKPLWLAYIVLCLQEDSRLRAPNVHAYLASEQSRTVGVLKTA